MEIALEMKADYNPLTSRTASRHKHMLSQVWIRFGIFYCI